MAGVKPLLETIGALLPKGIKAWHASPHDFDKVDLSKIGTGQGAASYGPGFYAAESPKVSGLGGEYWKDFVSPVWEKSDEPRRLALDFLFATSGDRAAATRDLRSVINRKDVPLPKHYTPETMQDALKVLESSEHIGPRVYELNLKADPRSFLQWDEPLTQQPKAVQDIYSSSVSYPRPTDKGHEIYQGLGYKLTGVEPGSAAAGIGLGQREAMGALKEAGIPGVRYLDAHSRALGPANDPAAQKQLADVTNAVERLRSLGDNLKASEMDQTRARLQRGLDTPRTYNYVVNNPDIIEIMRKLAIPGMVGGGAYTAYQPGQQQ